MINVIKFYGGIRKKIERVKIGKCDFLIFYIPKRYKKGKHRLNKVLNRNLGDGGYCLFNNKNSEACKGRRYPTVQFAGEVLMQSFINYCERNLPKSVIVYDNKTFKRSEILNLSRYVNTVYIVNPINGEQLREEILGYSGANIVFTEHPFKNSAEAILSLDRIKSCGFALNPQIFSVDALSKIRMLPYMYNNKILGEIDGFELAAAVYHENPSTFPLKFAAEAIISHICS